jgi:hypothetical protein
VAGPVESQGLFPYNHQAVAGGYAEWIVWLARDVAAGYARWEAAILACLTGMRDRGQLSADADPGRLATAVLAALQGGLLLAKVERDVRPLATALDVMISLIASLAPASPRGSSMDPC